MFERSFFTLLLVKLTITLAVSEESVVLWRNDEAELIPGTKKDGADGNDTIKEFHDITDFVHGLNHWNIIGMWSKYDVSTLSDEHKIVPENPQMEDQTMLICHAQPHLSSILEKKLPPLDNITVILGYYTATGSNFTMLGEVIDLIDKSKLEIYNYSFPHDLAEHNDTWVTETRKVKKNYPNGLMIKLTLSGEGIWATGGIEVHGNLPILSPIIGPGKPEPETNSTKPVPNSNSTEPSIEVNVTAVVNVTTESSNVTVDVNATTVSSNITLGNETNINANRTDTNGTYPSVPPGVPNTGVPGKPSSFEDNNTTAKPSSHFSEAPTSYVPEEVNVTIVPGSNWSNEPPKVNVTANPQVSVSYPVGENHTKAPEGHVPTEVSHPNRTEGPSANDSVPPPNTSGNPSKDSPKYPDSGYPSGIYDSSAFNDNVNKLAGVAQAIWDAFYVFLALFCACLVAIVGLIVRGRCNSTSGTMTTPLQLSPPTTPGPHPTASTRSMTTPASTPMQYERSV